MNIAMMSAWNTDSGVSVHAEMIGREWVASGHRLRVLSFFVSDFHGTTMVGRDEDYVVRCFTTATREQPYLDPRPFLESDYEIFVAQDVGMFPRDELGKIFHHIRRKASTVTVIHDSGPSSDPSFYQFDWDRIVCFDHRYEEFLGKYHPPERIRTIPFPCHPLKRGDQREARMRLGLPRDRRIVLIFGQRLEEHLPLLPVISDVGSQVPLLLLVVSEKGPEALRNVGGIEIEIRPESPPIERLYDYLHGSDVLILHRPSREGVVVSSAAYQCLGSGCPILATDSNFFERLGDAVVTFKDLSEFKESLLDILHKGKRFQASQKAAETFVKANSAEVVAQRYIELFQELRAERELMWTYLASRVPPWIEALPVGGRRGRSPSFTGRLVFSRASGPGNKTLASQ